MRVGGGGVGCEMGVDMGFASDGMLEFLVGRGVSSCISQDKQLIQGEWGRESRSLLGDANNQCIPLKS